MSFIQDLLDLGVAALTGKGLYPRDRILSAISLDGINWQREPGVRIDVGLGKSFGMAYYPHVVELSNGMRRMYFYGSSRGKTEWRSGIYSAISQDGLGWQLEPGVRLEAHGANFMSPVVQKVDNELWRMYFVEIDSGQTGRLFSAVSADGMSWTREEDARIDPGDIAGAESVLDGSLARTADGDYRMYFTVKHAERNRIHSAFSEDGIHWQVEKGVRIQNQPGMRLLANNPCVVSMPDGQGYRMYFRAGDSLALGNAIFLASSDDGMEWVVEKKVLEPSRAARYEQHGLGFPFVHPLPDGRWRMYYTGYWGRIWREKRVITAWERATARARQTLAEERQDL